MTAELSYEEYYAAKFVALTNEIDGTISCRECKYCQLNLKVKDRQDGYYCYHEDLLQNTLHSRQSVTTHHGFLCNKFSFFKGDGE